MKLVYFAWVRERIGKADEEVDIPAGVATEADLVRWLKGRGEEYAYAFENLVNRGIRRLQLSAVVNDEVNATQTVIHL